MEAGSLAMLFAAFEGKARAEGWIKPDSQPMLGDELRELMERFPDG